MLRNNLSLESHAAAEYGAHTHEVCEPLYLEIFLRERFNTNKQIRLHCDTKVVIYIFFSSTPAKHIEMNRHIIDN